MLILGVVLLTISLFGNGKENEPMTVGEKYSLAEKMMKNWEKTRNIDRLSEICDYIRFLPEKNGEKSMSKKKMALFFSLLNVMDKYYVPDYEIPSLNIAPPTRRGIVYDSGISPGSIKEPDIRYEYEKDLAKNKKKRTIANFQVQLQRLRNSWMEYSLNYLQLNFNEKAQIAKLPGDNITDEAARKELNKKLNKNKEGTSN